MNKFYKFRSYIEYKRMNIRNQRMGERISIVLDDDLNKELHDIQAKLIKESQKSVSFSAVLNDIVRTGLKSKS